mmetsp:Transcript_25987/g.53684  ORF Transcript_25987/g.53684 Transcript_25987/m.53684 type:complete len:477 (-) Transcript_25987:31-1461(-)
MFSCRHNRSLLFIVLLSSVLHAASSGSLSGNGASNATIVTSASSSINVNGVPHSSSDGDYSDSDPYDEYDEESDGDEELESSARSSLPKQRERELLRANQNNRKARMSDSSKPAFVTSEKKSRNATSNIFSPTDATSAVKSSNSKSGKEIFQQALKRAIGGGIPGAIAGVIQVLALMWLRTVINYQYRYGSTFTNALTTLYTTGGIPRLYSGLGFALIQAPLSRFVSTAANDGVTVLLDNLSWTQNWGPGRQVVVAAIVVGFFRMLLMPIDTCKTVLQIESGNGFRKLMAQVGHGHVHLLYGGALANALSSMIGHYPWFYTYNLLHNSEGLTRHVPWENCRNALIGFLSSIVSDTVANFMRVIKTTKQALGSTKGIEDGDGRGVTYAEAISVILAVDGWRGLFGRGLKTRIMGNALQSILFTVIWRGLADHWSRRTEGEVSSDFDFDRSNNGQEIKEGDHYDVTDVELTDNEAEVK